MLLFINFLKKNAEAWQAFFKKLLLVIQLSSENFIHLLPLRQEYAVKFGVKSEKVKVIGNLWLKMVPGQ